MGTGRGRQHNGFDGQQRPGPSPLLPYGYLPYQQHPGYAYPMQPTPQWGGYYMTHPQQAVWQQPGPPVCMAQAYYQPGFPQQQPGFPQQQPGYMQQQPGYPQQQPGFSQQQPGFSQQQPAFPQHPQMQYMPAGYGLPAQQPYQLPPGSFQHAPAPQRPTAEWQQRPSIDGIAQQFGSLKMRGNSGNQNPQPQGQGSRANAVSGRNAAQALSQKVQKSPREGGASAPAAQNGAARVFALDVECVATGMTCQDRAVAQIALVDENEQLILNLYVKPAEPVKSYLTALTGLTRELLEKQGVPFAQAMQQFYSCIPENAVLLSYNIDTDLAWLQLKHKIGRGEVRDLKGCYQFDPDSHKYSRKIWGQDHLAKVLLGITNERHDAAGDALKSMKLWRLYNDLKTDPQRHREALDKVDATTKEPSFSMKHPIYEGVCMGNRKFCSCHGPPLYAQPQVNHRPVQYGNQGRGGNPRRPQASGYREERLRSFPDGAKSEKAVQKLSQSGNSETKISSDLRTPANSDNGHEHVQVDQEPVPAE